MALRDLDSRLAGCERSSARPARPQTLAGKAARGALILGLAALSLALLTSCSGNKAEGESAAAAALMNQAVPVTVGKVTRQTVPVEVRTIGTGEAYSTVSVKSLVDGQIKEVHFQEGQDVKSGDLLFTIDSRPFEAMLAQAQANLARDQAQLSNARAQQQRNQQLFEQQIISRDQYETFKTTAEALEATVHADQAAIDNAKIELGYCAIRSPIDGRTGSLMVHAGNIVKSNTDTLVTINRITPIYVDFSVPEQYLAEIRKYGTKGALKVEALIPPDTGHPEWGAVSFINNTVDSTTGTLMLKGTFANPGKRLWPGQFVNVVLDLTSQPNATVAPSSAVQTGQKGFYAFVVKDDQTVELRLVKPGATVGGSTVIQSGLQPGETVVTDGQLRLFPGAHVEIKQGL